ncbi:hypothetical protein OG21DRAFT_1492589 [Imleria badia]|nr:hypothetical protein OG21DRAFT_1492589 [Imleria badia]
MVQNKTLLCRSLAPMDWPLPRALLDDPAFSPDPRSHPHFPLANARSYKVLPSKSLPDGLPPSAHSDSDSLVPPLSSATCPSATKPPPPQRPLPVPEILPRPDTKRQVLKPVRTNIPRKTRMKALVRRLTTRHNLDCIDELDETDPFGGSYHHDGPYEAIGTNLAQPHSSSDAPRKSSKRESDPHPFRPGQYQPASRVPPAYGETGLSLHLEPGQILQQNTIYTSHASSMATVPGQFYPQPDPDPIPTPPHHSRRKSQPIPRTRSTQDPSSLDLRVGVQNHHSSSLRTPQERYPKDYMPDFPNSPPLGPLHYDRDAPHYVPHHTEKTVFPPPRYESRLYSSVPPRSPQRTPPPDFNPASPKTQSTEGAVPALPRRDSRHKSGHSLDSSYTKINSTFTQSFSSIQNKPLDPLRIRHLPKRLVMPAPLQPQPPQPQYKFSPAEPPFWQDEYPDVHALEGAHFERQPAIYSQEPRLLRKKSSAFPAKTPIPDHIPMSQNDAVPKMGNSPTKTANEGTKERIRRRRLSKRKSDI